MSQDTLDAQQQYAEMFFKLHPDYLWIKNSIEESWNEEGVWWHTQDSSTHFQPWLQVIQEIAHLLPDGE